MEACRINKNNLINFYKIISSYKIFFYNASIIIIILLFTFYLSNVFLFSKTVSFDEVKQENTLFLEKDMARELKTYLKIYI